jgi:hypothetical protein
MVLLVIVFLVPQVLNALVFRPAFFLLNLLVG